MSNVRPSSFVAGLQSTLTSRGLLVGHGHVLVAVSGGADSVALLLGLHALHRRMGFRVMAAHLDHRLRGEAAREDAAFVAALAGRLGVPCVTGRADVRRLARRKHVSLEMAAREARYRFLARSAHACHASVIATAHTADDQAETVLLRLVRGAGPTGLGGIRWCGRVSDMGVDTPHAPIQVIRPLLGVPRRAIELFLRRQGESWREDTSNTCPDFLRNRVRHELLPLLESRFNPSIRAALRRTAAILSAEEAWIGDMVLRMLTVCVDADGGLNREALVRAPLPLRRRVIRRWLVAMGVPAEAIDFGVVERVGLLAATSRGSREVALPGPWRVVRRYGRLAVSEAPVADTPFRTALNVPGETLLPDQGLRVTITRAAGVVREAGDCPGQLPARASLSCAAVGRRRLYLRGARPGDRMQPYGMRGSRKLQDILVDAKVPADQRSAVPVLECGGDIAWLPGYRIAHPFRVAGERSASLHLCLERL